MDAHSCEVGYVSVGSLEKNSGEEVSVEVRLLAQTEGIGGVVLYNCVKVWMTVRGVTRWASRRL